MDVLERMQRASEFIETHLTGNLSLQDVASSAFYSYPHFQELFRKLTGINLKDYIRGRRLALAAKDLLCTELRVLDIALKYGFECHESFTRAFYREYCMTPQRFRSDVLEMEVLRKHDFINTGRFKINCFEPKLVARRDTRFFGLERNMKINSGTENREEAAFVHRVLTDRQNPLAEMIRKENLSRDWVIGACSRINPQNGTYLFQSGFVQDNLIINARNAPASLYLMYETDLNDAEHSLFSDWLHDRLVPYRDNRKLIFNLHTGDDLYHPRKIIRNYFPVNIPA